MKKLTSILLVLALVFTFTACKKEEPPVQIDFNTWFNSEFVTAYDAFVKTESGKKAPFPDISLMLTDSSYLESVLKYIKDGTQPSNGSKITEADGVYTYKAQTLIQTFEFDNNSCSIRVTSTMMLNGESKPQFTVTMREKDDVYYIQYLASEFRTYHEVSFTTTNGSVKNAGRIDLPYSIFAAEIPENFAKEN